MPATFLTVSVPFLAGACILFGARFTSHFLYLYRSSIYLSTSFNLLAGSGVILMLLSPLQHGRIAAIGTSFVSPAFVLLSLGTGIFLIPSRGRPAIFYTLALSIITLGVVMNGLRNFGILPDVFWTAHGYLVGSVVEFAILAIALIDRIASIEREKEVARSRLQQAEHLATQSRLRALQAQINPHFLFNALNTVVGLISVDAKRAEKLVTDLSRLFRHTLTVSEKRMVTLAEELEIIRSYLAIEKVRFGNRLEYDVVVDGNPKDVSTIGLIIQPVVENSIKHGISSLTSGGRIDVHCRISESDIYVEVRDTGKGFGSSRENSGAGHGLGSVEERLRLAYGKRGRLTRSNRDGAVVEIAFPKLGAS
jgi:two-component sensor histidine kinase